MQGHCSTCRWWGYEPHNGMDDSGNRLRECGSPKMMRGYHIHEHAIPDDGAWVEDDEGWAILTGPAFGCVLWEDRTDA